MKHIIFFSLIFALGACAQPESGPKVMTVSAYHSPTIDYEIAMNDPYDIEYEIEESTEGQFNLAVTITPKGGSFFVSPNSTQDFKGYFRVETAENEHLNLGEDFEENPRSVEVIEKHPFINGPVNWVHEKTTYKYPILINSEEDFTVGAKIIFVIEPKCTLEEIPLFIKQTNGKLTVDYGRC